MKQLALINKPIKLKHLIFINISLLWLTFVFHFVSLRETTLNHWYLNRLPDLLGRNVGFNYFLWSFGLVVIFFYLNSFLTIGHLITAYIFRNSSMNFTIAIKNMRFNRAGLGDNLVRLITYIFIGLTPYLVLESFANTGIIMPLTFFHMILMAITTFMHGIMLLAMYRILSPRFANFIKKFHYPIATL